MISWAAYDGNLELLKWLRAKGCPWNEKTCECAAMQGQYRCLVYAHKNGCPCGQKTCYEAAYACHRCLRYLRQNGCPWTAEARDHAVQRGYADTFGNLVEADDDSDDDDYY